MKTSNINPLIIAEIGVNHFDIAQLYGLSPIDAAKKMISESKNNGAHVAKFQSYKAEKIAAKFSPSYWDTNEEKTDSQIELFKKFDSFGKDEFQELSNYCNNIKIEFMSTGFDVDSLNYINDLVVRHKIASADLTNIELIKTIAGFNKPVIMSTGASTINEISTAVKLLKDFGIKDLTLLHCVLNYPTKLSNANLWMINYLKENFNDCKIGYSDHTKFNINVLMTSILLGSQIIEKHFTLDKTLKGNDHYHAMDSEDLALLNKTIHDYKNFIGVKNTEDDLILAQKDSRLNARRGVYFERNVKARDLIKKEHVKFLRPQLNGISTLEFDNLLEKKARYSKNFNKGELFTDDKK